MIDQKTHELLVEAFLEAAKMGLSGLVEEILAIEPLDFFNLPHGKAMAIAIEHGHVAVARALLAAAPDPWVYDGGTLGYAIECGHFEVFKLLFERGPGPIQYRPHNEQVRVRQRHSIWRAAKYGHLEIYRYLLHFVGYDDDAYEEARKRGHFELVRLTWTEGAIPIKYSAEKAAAFGPGDWEYWMNRPIFPWKGKSKPEQMRIWWQIRFAQGYGTKHKCFFEKGSRFCRDCTKSRG